MKLKRTTFETSRLLEFFTEKELTMQIGQSPELWKLAILKELIDNALDACEIAEVQPRVDIEIMEDRFTVRDNGPGIPEETVEQSLDYMIRVSDKAYYISPTRGQLGNALKCVYAAPFVETGEKGKIIIECSGKSYAIEISLDRLAQTPKLEITNGPSEVTDGTFLTIFWQNSASLLSPPGWDYLYRRPGPDTALELIQAYAMFNPHASFTLNDKEWTASITDWRKWKPNNPISAHWYNDEQLKELIAAYIVADRNHKEIKTVRQFVMEFRGLARTQKAREVTEDANLHGDYLKDLVEDDDIALWPVQRLLTSMQKHSAIVRPYLLGAIGKEHLIKRMETDYNVEPESVRYRKVTNQGPPWPHVLEVAFGIYTEEYEDTSRSLITGLNWSPTMDIPVPEINAVLRQQRIDTHDPVCLVIHITRPRFEFTDRGKSKFHV